MNYEEKAAFLVEKGSYKRAVKLMTKCIKNDPDDHRLYRIRFEYGQFIPFDKLYHEAAEDFFNDLLSRQASGNVIHDHYSVYMSTTQGRIALSDELLVNLAGIFAGYGFINDAVYLINRMIRKNAKPEGLVDAIISLVNYYIDNQQKQKSTQYVQYLVDFHPAHPMTRYIIRVYKQAR